MLTANPLGITPPNWMPWFQAALPTFFYTFRGFWIAGNSIPDYNPRIAWYQKHPLITRVYLISVMGILGCISIRVVIFENQYILFSKYILCLMPALLFSILYYPNILIKNGLRSVGIMKPFILGITWSLSLVFPLLSLSQNISPVKFLVFFCNLFLFFSSLGMLSDCKDAKDDRDKGLFTFSVIYGWRFANTLIALPMLCVSAGLDFILMMHAHTMLAGISALIFVLLAFAISIKTNPESSFLHNHFGIDGLMLIKALIGFMVLLA